MSIEVLGSESIKDGDVVLLHVPEGAIAVSELSQHFMKWADERGLQNCMFIVSPKGASIEVLSRGAQTHAEKEAQKLRAMATALEKHAKEFTEDKQ